METTMQCVILMVGIVAETSKMIFAMNVYVLKFVKIPLIKEMAFVMMEITILVAILTEETVV